VTVLLYLYDSYLREFDASVTRVAESAGVVLDRTAFYPGGGGQPNDTGALSFGGSNVTVTGLRRVDGDIVHLLDEAGPWPEAGDAVRGTIDWEPRYRLMRTHTAMHVLCGVIFREYGALVTGGNMGLDKARMDFELEDLSADRVARIESLCNQVVQEDRPVSWRALPRDEAFQIPDLIRTKINLLPPAIKEVRVVEIADLDLQADGGTHVRRTGEIGGLSIVGTRSKGKSNKRLEIAISDG
jgi:misacylated tRNA(Ala) deacylase